MKRTRFVWRFFAIFVVAALSVSLSACGGGDEPDYDENYNNNGYNNGYGITGNNSNSSYFIRLSGWNYWEKMIAKGSVYIYNGYWNEDYIYISPTTYFDEAQSFTPYEINGSYDVNEGDYVTFIYNPVSSSLSVAKYNDGGSGSEGSSSEGSNNGGTTNQKPSAPTGLTASQAGPKAYPYVYLSWYNNNNADYYTVYRSTSMYGSYSKLGTTYATSFADEKNITNGKTYYYKVTATNSSNKESDYSNIVSVTINTTIVEAPGIKTCSVKTGSKQITISWTYASSSGYSAPDQVRLISEYGKNIFSWTTASSKKSHTVKASDLVLSNGDLQYENVLYLQVQNSGGEGKGAKIVWNWMYNTGYILGDLCGYTTF